jgi:hypothetical protein
VTCGVRWHERLFIATFIIVCGLKILEGADTHRHRDGNTVSFSRSVFMKEGTRVEVREISPVRSKIAARETSGLYTRNMLTVFK